MKFSDGEEMQVTLALIKPDAVRAGHVPAILLAMEEQFHIASIVTAEWRRDEVAVFYAEHTNKPFFRQLLAFMTSAPIYAVALMSPGGSPADTILKWRALMGATDPKKAAPGTIRARFAAMDGVIMHNVVHGSDSWESAQRELEFIGKTFSHRFVDGVLCGQYGNNVYIPSVFEK